MIEENRILELEPEFKYLIAKLSDFLCKIENCRYVFERELQFVRVDDDDDDERWRVDDLAQCGHIISYLNEAVKNIGDIKANYFETINSYSEKRNTKILSSYMTLREMIVEERRESEIFLERLRKQFDVLEMIFGHELTRITETLLMCGKWLENQYWQGWNNCFADMHIEERHCLVSRMIYILENMHIEEECHCLVSRMNDILETIEEYLNLH